jgi:hypothetical protein
LSGVKACYERTPNVGFYESTRNHHDPDIFCRICGESPEAFDALLLECRAAIEQPFESDAHAIHANMAVELRPRVRARSLRTEEMLFLFLVIMSGPVDGSIGILTVSKLFGVSGGTVSNLFKHTLKSVYRSLKMIRPQLIAWPEPPKRKAMRGLICGFPMALAFVDGTKVRSFRPDDPIAQELRSS